MVYFNKCKKKKCKQLAKSVYIFILPAESFDLERHYSIS